LQLQILKKKDMRTFGIYYYGKKSYKKQLIGIGISMSESMK